MRYDTFNNRSYLISVLCFSTCIILTGCKESGKNTEDTSTEKTESIQTTNGNEQTSSSSEPTKTPSTSDNTKADSKQTAATVQKTAPASEPATTTNKTNTVATTNQPTTKKQTTTTTYQPPQYNNTRVSNNNSGLLHGSSNGNGVIADSQTGGTQANISLQPTEQSGDIATKKITFSPNVTTACDSKWTIRILGIHRSRQLLPNHTYQTSCTPTGGKPKLFTSLTVEKDNVSSGMIIESQLDSSGNMVPTGVTREFKECKEMHGIAANSDCSVIGALCRRAGNASKTASFTKDMVASIPDSKKAFRDWITQPGINGSVNDEEWLYDWADGNISSKPKQYVADKAIGNWELGKQDLVYSNTQNSYGLSLEAAVGTHDGDSFLVVDRSDFSINTSRGWKWACAAGHTLFNHAVFNPATNKYAAICGTDLGATEGKSGGYGGLWVKVEGNKSQGFLSIPVIKQNYAGGVTGILPLADGGFLGVFAGAKASSPKQEYRDKGPTTSIGMAKFDAYGKIVGDIKWVVSDKDWFHSYPQLASLGNGKYLLGYARMVQLSKRAKLGVNRYGDAIRLPESFHVMEVDATGKALTQPQTVKHGWGEQDRMVSLEQGKVAWTYIPKAQYTPEATGAAASLPGCKIGELALNVYQSK